MNLEAKTVLHLFLDPAHDFWNFSKKWVKKLFFNIVDIFN